MHDVYADERRRHLRLEIRERNSLIFWGAAYLLLIIVLTVWTC